jgi:threonine aldolase
MGAEAVVFFPQDPSRQPTLATNFLYLRKQSMQLASKMRFIAAQLEALLTNDLWLSNARHSNRMAKVLEKEVCAIPRVKIAYPVDANGVFVKLPRSAISKLLERYFFYIWNEEESLVRWMCSFDTTEEDIREFGKFLRETLNG